MIAQQPVPKMLDASMKGMSKLKLGGAILTVAGLLIAGHAAVQLFEIFAGHPLALHVEILYVESGVAMVLSVVGFGMLVAAAEPFDESDQPPMLKYEDQIQDPFE